jgi:hypothetical protein
LLRIVWELRVPYDELVKIVSEEISTGVPAMSIEHTEECAFRPRLALLGGRLHDVQDDRDSIFVVISDDALIGVGRVPRDHSVLSH